MAFFNSTPVLKIQTQAAGTTRMRVPPRNVGHLMQRRKPPNFDCKRFVGFDNQAKTAAARYNRNLERCFQETRMFPKGNRAVQHGCEKFC
ncbi:hypothetical protein DSM3645_01505 [Blastopirellula marina DSM 3645]|uniref:Uncharacterized protein n=1 Tax=Blastopirellula marina DSM 3645 TaxID=314230 RepID=A3ZN20_9BACT|nr:hypothetical protein DSM3645_01505 [Blastopirellula marina DSM 3645]